MKIAIFTDTHFGASKSNQHFLDSQHKFFKELLIPYCKDNSISTMICMGDFYDNRQTLNIKVSTEVHNLFENDLKDFDFHLLVGNHDTYYRTTTETNSLKHLSIFQNVTVYEQTTEVSLGNRKFCFVPWITDDEKFVNYTNSISEKFDAVFGHFEIKSFMLNSKISAESGFTSDQVIKLSDRIFSGHFHTRSKKEYGNSFIEYIGNIVHLTRNDIGQNKGFIVLDTETMKHEYINNDISMKFIKIFFPNKFVKKDIIGNIIDVQVDKLQKYNEEDLRLYLEVINKYNPIYYPKVTYINAFNNESVDLSCKAQTTEEMIVEYIENSSIENKQFILEKLLDLYTECKKTNDI